jgi:hypothetical protein
MWRGGFNARSSRKQRKTALQELREWDATTFDEILQGLDAYRGRSADGEVGFQINVHGEQRWPSMLDIAQADLSRLCIRGVGSPTIYVDHSEQAIVRIADVNRIEVSNLVFRKYGSVQPTSGFRLDNADKLKLLDLEDYDNEFSFVYWIYALNACENVEIERNRAPSHIGLSLVRAGIVNNDLEGVILTTGSTNCRVVGNTLTGVSSDSSSSGNNAATGNTGGGTFTNWTGTGSVAGDNT